MATHLEHSAPGDKPKTDRVLAAAILSTAALGAWITAGFVGFSYDDAFITYRYAAHWLQDGILRYNPGEVVLGTTAPGYAALLGTLAAVLGTSWRSVPILASLISVGSIYTIAACIALFCRPHGAKRGWACACSYAALALTFQWNVEMWGSEFLPGCAFVALGAFTLFERKRPGLAGLLFAVAAILRLELVLAGMACLLVDAARARKLPLAASATLALPIALYLASLQLEFGRISPNTLDVKLYGAQLLEQNYTGAQWHWLQRSLSPISGFWLIAFACLGAITLARHSRPHPMAAALAIWIAAHEAMYRLLGVAFTPWYHVPTLQVALALFVVAAARLATAVARTTTGGLRRPIALSVFVAILSPVLTPSIYFVTTTWGSAPDPRLPIYRQIARDITKRARPGDIVASMEIGVLGYESRQNILDLIGLVSPEVHHGRRRGELPAVVAAAAPRFIVTAPQFQSTIDSLLDHPDMRGQYRPAAHYPAPTLSGGAFTLLERRPPGSDAGIDPIDRPVGK